MNNELNKTTSPPLEDDDSNISESDETVSKSTPPGRRFLRFLKKHIIAAVISLITVLTSIGIFIFTFLPYSKSVSDLKLTLINSVYRYTYSNDYLRIGANNNSDDDKPLTKAIIHVTGIRNDDTPNIQAISSPNQKRLKINICNKGWSDLKNVTIEADPEQESYQNLKNPEKFKLTLSTMEHGRLYIVREVTIADFKDPQKAYSVALRCHIKGEKDYYQTACGFGYNPTTGDFSILGKGGNTEIYDLEYCIKCENGTGDFDYSLSYTCPAHKYEEIHFSITADRSCYVSYYIEFYAMDKMLLKTKESGAHFTIDSTKHTTLSETTAA